jgi:thiol-disulfide isomerase/thioredoxin
MMARVLAMFQAMDRCHEDPMTDRNRRFAPAAVLALAIAVAGCGGSMESPAGATAAPGAGAVPSHASAAQTSSPPTGSAGPSASVPAPSAPGTVLAQDWATAALVDVATGETFRIADHAGRVIIIETMAIWCPNCRAQQADVMTALQELPADAVAFIVLDIDPNEDAASLAAYRERNGFEGRYAIAGTAVARALAAEFGDQILNPPSTPIVLIGRDGRVTLTEFGHKSTRELVEMARLHGA